jgi:adenine-specific DNA-methyltransferase
MPHASDATDFRRTLRCDSTDAEARLWNLLRNRRLGPKFRRQHQLGPYVLDFYCAEHQLAIELDGGQHFDPCEMERDARRTAFLEAQGIRVVRFTNVEVFGEVEGVMQVIWDEIGGA